VLTTGHAAGVANTSAHTACNTGPDARAVLVVAASVVVRTAANGARLAFETVDVLSASGQTALVLLELAHADGRQGADLVVLGFVVVHLMDWHGGVHDVGLDGFTLNDGLDRLVDVVVDVLAGDGGIDGASLLRLRCPGLVAEARGCLGQLLLHLVIFAVVELALLRSGDVVVMLLWQNLLVVYGLDSRVVVVLVDLLVDGGGDVLVLLGLDGLFRHSRRDILVDGRVMVAGLVHEL